MLKGSSWIKSEIIGIHSQAESSNNPSIIGGDETFEILYDLLGWVSKWFSWEKLSSENKKEKINNIIICLMNMFPC